MAWLRRAVIAVLALTVALAGVGIWRLNAVAERVIEERGTRALGVDTTIDFISIGAFPPGLRIAGFEIENPPGFEARNFLAVNSGALAVRPGSLRGRVLESPSLVLEDVELDLERTLGGETNYGILLANLRGGEGAAEPPADAPADAGPARTFRIDTVRIRDVTARLGLALPGRSGALAVRIPEIALRDVGTARGAGLDTGQLLGVLVVGILEALAREGDLPAALAGDLLAGIAGLRHVPFEVSGEIVRTGGALAGGAARAAAQAAERAAEEAGEAVGEAGRQVGGALQRAGRQLDALLPDDEAP